MSSLGRVGSLPVLIPAGVSVDHVSANSVVVRSVRGEFNFVFATELSLDIEGSEMRFCEALSSRHLGVGGPSLIGVEQRGAASKGKNLAMVAGLYRSLLNNLIIGVSTGFSKVLLMVGVGYKVSLDPAKNYLTIHLGYSHLIKYRIPNGITIDCPRQTEMVVRGMDKQLVGAVVADICKFRKYNPYKGKGIVIQGKFMIRKEAKKK